MNTNIYILAVLHALQIIILLLLLLILEVLFSIQ